MDEKSATAYGWVIQINIDEETTRQFIEKHRESIEQVVDVHVSFRGEEREFTLDEFTKRLGYGN